VTRFIADKGHVYAGAGRFIVAPAWIATCAGWQALTRWPHFRKFRPFAIRQTPESPGHPTAFRAREGNWKRRGGMGGPAQPFLGYGVRNVTAQKGRGQIWPCSGANLPEGGFEQALFSFDAFPPDIAAPRAQPIAFESPEKNPRRPPHFCPLRSGAFAVLLPARSKDGRRFFHDSHAR